MIKIKINDDNELTEIEVSEEFAKEYFELNHKENLLNRKETRRHQSLDKSLEHGFDIADNRIDIQEQLVVDEEKEKLYAAI